MKTTNRVHKNGDTKAATAQAQILSIDRYVLAFLDSKTREAIAEIPLTPDQFAAVEKHARSGACSLNTTLEIGLNPMTRDIPTTELEFAVAQSNALLQLLLEGMESQLNGSRWSEEFANKMSGGISELIIGTQDRLEKAHTAVFESIYDTPTSRRFHESRGLAPA